MDRDPALRNGSNLDQSISRPNSAEVTDRTETAVQVIQPKFAELNVGGERLWVRIPMSKRLFGEFRREQNRGSEWRDVVRF